MISGRNTRNRRHGNPSVGFLLWKLEMSGRGTNTRQTPLWFSSGRASGARHSQTQWTGLSYDGYCTTAEPEDNPTSRNGQASMRGFRIAFVTFSSPDWSAFIPNPNFPAAVNCKGTLEDQSFVSGDGASQKKRKAVIRKESSETKDYVSREDMEVESDKSLEVMGNVPSAVGEPLRVKHMCDKKCNQRSSSLFDFAAIGTEEGGTPQTIKQGLMSTS